jgi:hypothetical protein
VVWFGLVKFGLVWLGWVRVVILNLNLNRLFSLRLFNQVCESKARVPKSGAWAFKCV